MAVKFWRRPHSGRSAVHACNGMVVSSQPLASQTGVRILEAGGNACDAIVAMAAVLNVVEPFSTGIGGDAFALLYLPSEKTLKSINGSGFAPKGLSYDYLVNELKLDQIPKMGVLPITVPGAVGAWGLIHETYGRLQWEDILQPAIQYAQDGFPVSPVIAQVWKELVPKLLSHQGAKKTYLINDQRAPLIGEIFKQKNLGSTLRIISKQGADAFYRGDLSNQIVEFLQQEGGFIQTSDLKNYKAEWTTPVSREIYNNIVWEHGPNGQGLVTLLILSIVEELDIARYPHNSADYLHYLVEAKKLAFADAFANIADPDHMTIPLSKFLSEEYAQTHASQINPRQAMMSIPTPLQLGDDTVYLTAADKDGMAVSFINSLFYGFGSGVVDPNTGIAFQNRGAGFSLIKGHPNQYMPNKRPFHTIIPGMITSPENELLYSFGVMGGHHQPQGQAQVFLNLILQEMDPQDAISCPRFHHDQFTNTVAFEEPIGIGVRSELRKRGHSILDSVGTNFGGGQIIQRNLSTGCYIGGSDPRKDGQVQGF
ncbi:MAG: gamma-glutamyltransferase [Candidatus Heimdallarchaeota archaeon]|nr:MAG: gamma-glutamyltransferase [Candidatus Heimdallarchaeota archaeon]